MFFRSLTSLLVTATLTLGACGAPDPGPKGPAGANGVTGPTGSTGPAGADGVDGEDGLSCWDLDGSGTCDATEDIDSDGLCTAVDCQGAQGPEGPAPATPTCPPAFETSIAFPEKLLCLHEEVFTESWNSASEHCSNNGAQHGQLCSYQQLRRACITGNLTVVPDRWLSDRVGDDLAVVTNSTDCENFDTVRQSTLGGLATGSYCCQEYPVY